ncbi:4114_t:CDS:2 [Funneliformis geosporum]|uniref:4702_t:CDS:1 n=1 Tax=Funneliformis geosporum TaxID=1117311 RepID=A0A9W4WXD4_9GLOM|nr:4114_t:CDS:2 [Funneliformis geosporum]CAI2170621.1 4702_t:CDS:2 [Funneliformis geosporum]
MSDPSNNSLKEPIISMTSKHKPNSRRNNSSMNRAIRNKFTNKGSIRSDPYLIQYSTRSQARQQGLMTETSSTSTIVDSNATTESTGTTTEPAAQPHALTTGRKRHCAKCKESANIVKMIDSKMSRIEELIENLKKVTGQLSNEFKNNSLTQTISFGKPGVMDLSKMSIDEIQKFVMFITNKIVTTSNHSQIPPRHRLK